MYKKLDGSKALSNILLPSFIPKPTLSGLGIISSSSESEIPAPNFISRLLLALNLVTNLFDTFLVLSR